MRFISRCRQILAPSVVLLAVAAGCSAPVPGDASATPEAPSITVFAAASLTDVIAAMNEAYDGGGRLRTNLGSSAQLSSQLLSGAPADVVIAADLEALDTVRDEGLIARERVVAGNTTVLALAPGNPGQVAALADLSENRVQTAVCAPSVPCGRAAARVLDAAGVALSGESREDSARSVLTKVVTGQADAGLVYQTDALSAAKQGVTYLEVRDPEPNQYPAALTAEGAEHEAAVRFYEWLAGEEAAGILRDAGFRTPGS
ncbi:molybdate ABC transporter substrate-binding protein [Arthrobacter sp. zg-Y820]|uniref:molybdate ABC transporter substrate-binding protein n=1 Tax=unclassified Arthrobacter TaxID=235627 RepID=UPI001E4BF24C|nr:MULTISPECIES: molybdate ABC transporter substrate-binding protein [unclassified Arthrobacter]MCC9198173.1 molybdate ABC transporter substrate-binding protein [Arthrobacter sp. zg-Y820]MDK1281041.1 molybdate ABC transporter substrate-binding protein [Arthrobacter sp. zg.Y820]WIB10503.1 molybdate ABC transporter substrate-binding protein [Arthrobacter sp. zg-Y820]